MISITPTQQEAQDWLVTSQEARKSISSLHVSYSIFMRAASLLGSFFDNKLYFLCQPMHLIYVCIHDNMTLRRASNNTTVSLSIHYRMQCLADMLLTFASYPNQTTNIVGINLIGTNLCMLSRNPEFLHSAFISLLYANLITTLPHFVDDLIG